MSSGGAVSFLRIPGNIKQDFAPFQLSPGGGLQKFSFRPSTLSKNPSAGLLNIVPSSVAQQTEYFINDISYYYQKNYIRFNDILNMLPGITIREYLPDSKLDQSLNLFGDIFSSIFKGKENKEDSKSAKNVEDATKKSTDLQDKLKNVVDAVMQYVDDMGFFNLVCPNDADGSPGISPSNKEYASVVKFPFTLYYRLQSCQNTNVYELPCVPQNNAMYSSNGHPGWESGSSGMRFLPDFAKNIPVIGKFVDTLFGNLGINFTPWWDASSGSKTPAPELEFKFSLFNDSIDAAISNFIFVQTIIAHCRWIQYGIMQHSASLYDISIAGIGKQYACMGNFDIQYKGTLREPSDTLISKLKGYVGSRYKSSIANKQYIKIPDVYDVTMKFQSLLPANFNTFIFNFAQRDLMQLGDKEKSSFTGFQQSIKKIVDVAKEAWNK